MILAIVLTIVLGTAIGSILLGRRAARTSSMTEWAVGGRRLGTLMYWFLNAGESYSTVAVFGIAGYAWALGAPAYLAFSTLLVYVVGYWLMPKVWRSGRRFGHITQADFYAARYDAKWLGVVTGLIGVAALVIYVQIQLVSVSLIVQLTLEEVSSDVAVVMAGVLMLAFVAVTGLRSAVYANAVKDVLMVVILVILVATVSSKVGASSPLDIFRLAEQQHPGFGRLPGIDPGGTTTSLWLISASLQVAIGTWLLPQLFQFCYAAESATAIRRTNVWMPLYGLSFVFILILGTAALVAGTEPANGDPNAALLTFVTNSYPAWAVGLLAATGFLLALGPGAALLIAASSTLARNVVAPLRPDITDRSTLRAARVALVAITVAAIWLTIANTGSLIDILLKAYAAIGMLAPAAFLGFLWRRTTAIGVLAGIVVGFVALLAPFATDFWREQMPSIDTGLIALLINSAVAVLVSLVTPQPPKFAVDVGFALSADDVPDSLGEEQPAANDGGV